MQMLFTRMVSAENADFQEIVMNMESSLSTFSGYDRKMGDKITAKETMIKANVPVVPFGWIDRRTRA